MVTGEHDRGMEGGEGRKPDANWKEPQKVRNGTQVPSSGRHEVCAGRFVGVDIAATPWSATRARDVFRRCPPLRCFSH